MHPIVRFHISDFTQFRFLVENMANRTVKDAHSVKGTNPQYLIEKIIRTRIYESKFWKEQCFALSGSFRVL